MGLYFVRSVSSFGVCFYELFVRDRLEINRLILHHTCFEKHCSWELELWVDKTKSKNWPNHCSFRAGGPGGDPDINQVTVSKWLCYSKWNKLFSSTTLLLSPVLVFPLHCRLSLPSFLLSFPLSAFSPSLSALPTPLCPFTPHPSFPFLCYDSLSLLFPSFIFTYSEFYIWEPLSIYVVE